MHTIGEVSHRYNISLRTLRFYESCGLVTPLRKGRHRFYTDADVDKIGIILEAKDLGFAINQISQLIRTPAAGGPFKLDLPSDIVVEQLKVMRARLLKVSEAVKKLEALAQEL